MATDNISPFESGVSVGGDSPVRQLFDAYAGRNGYTILPFRGLELRSADYHSRDVSIGVDRQTGEDAVLPYEYRDLGVNIIGQTGTGKSSLVERFILNDLKCGTPGILFDPHGRLAQRVVSLAKPDDADRISFLTPLPQPFGLNLLACRKSAGEGDDPVSGAVISLIATVKKLFGDADLHLPRLVTNLDLAARTLIPSGSTLVHALRLFINAEFREQCLAHVSDEKELADLRDQWAFYDSIPARDRPTYLEAFRSRLREMLAPKVMQETLGSSTTTIPFHEVLEENRRGFLIVSLPSSDSMPRELCDFIGSMTLCALADRVFARYKEGCYDISGEYPPRFHLYLDEYQRFATPTTAELLTQGRKFGAGVTLAHQGTEQIRDELVRDAGRQARTQIIFSLTGPDADAYARLLPVKPKPERIEWVTHPHETIDEKVPTGQPVRLLRSNPPKNARVREAVRLLFEPAPLAPGEEFRSRHSQVNVNDPDEDVRINQLLVDAMDGKLREPKVYTTRLIELLYAFSESSMEDQYNGRLAYRETDPHIAPWTTWSDEVKDDILAALRAWLNVHLTYKEHLLDGVTTGVEDSYDPLPMSGPDPLKRMMRGVARGRFKWADSALLKAAVQATNYNARHSADDRQETIDTMRSRLRCVIVLCDELAEHPILESSGQQIPKTEPVSRPAQTQQDVWNVLASRLANPNEPYVAHIKTLDGYHEVKLSQPVDGRENRDQFEKVKRRSQERYRATQRELPESVVIQDSEPPPAGTPTQHATVASPPSHRPTISRRSPEGNQ